MPPSCGIVALSEDDQITLVSQWRYTLGKMSLEIPTGGSDPGETPAEAARRELAEETGLTAGRWTPLGAIDNSNGVTTDVAHLFLARDLRNGPPHPQGNEPIGAALDDLRGRGVGRHDRAITESVSVAAILKTQLLRSSANGRGEHASRPAT